MAVKVSEVHLNHISGTAMVSLFADTKEEITNDMTIEGVPEGFSIELGSTAMTANGELAFRKSDGTWNWLG